jgi:hypothetical protein
MSEEQIIPSIPEDYKPAAWLVMPKYNKRELQWLCEKLQSSNFELRQSLFHLKEQLRRMDNEA